MSWPLNSKITQWQCHSWLLNPYCVVFKACHLSCITSTKKALNKSLSASNSCLKEYLPLLHQLLCWLRCFTLTETNWVVVEVLFSNAIASLLVSRIRFIRHSKIRPVQCHHPRIHITKSQILTVVVNISLKRAMSDLHTNKSSTWSKS
jgi:hypothetical protein